MDNVDTVYKWLPDTLAKYSTGEVIRKRKLYSDKEQVEFRGDAALVINSVKPSLYLINYKYSVVRW